MDLHEIAAAAATVLVLLVLFAVYAKLERRVDRRRPLELSPALKEKLRRVEECYSHAASDSARPLRARCPCSGCESTGVDIHSMGCVHMRYGDECDCEAWRSDHPAPLLVMRIDRDSLDRLSASPSLPSSRPPPASPLASRAASPAPAPAPPPFGECVWKDCYEPATLSGRCEPHYWQEFGPAPAPPNAEPDPFPTIVKLYPPEPDPFTASPDDDDTGPMFDPYEKVHRDTGVVRPARARRSSALPAPPSPPSSFELDEPLTSPEPIGFVDSPETPKPEPLSPKPETPKIER